MGEVYDALDLLVLTSNNEGTPVTVIEAMVSGIPVVATAVGGVPELLGGGVKGKVLNGVEIAQHGVIIPPGSEAGLARAISIALSDSGPAREAVGRAMEFARERFGRERLVRDIENLYIKSLDMV